MMLGQITSWIALAGVTIDSLTRTALVAVALWSRDADRRTTARTILGIRQASPGTGPGTGSPHQPRPHDADGIVALAAPRDAVPGAPAAVYGVHRDGIVVRRPAEPEPGPWARAGTCPPGPRGLTVANNHFFLLDDSGRIWSLAQGEIGTDGAAWTLVADGPGLIALASLNGRLIAIHKAGRLLGRLPVPGADWADLGDAGGCLVLTGHAGALYAAGPGQPLLRGG